MKKKDDAQLLSLKTMLQGLESIYSPSGSTFFSLTLNTGVRTYGHIVWLQQQLASWADFLNKEAGGQVISMDIQEKEKYYSEIRADIVLKYMIPGEIDTRNVMDDEVSQMLRGQLKKILAKRLCDNFSPSFDLKNPLFAAGTQDQYLIFAHRYCVDLAPDQLEVLFCDETRRAIAEITEQHGARLVDIVKAAEERGVRTCHAVVVVWESDASGQRRHNLNFALSQFLTESKGLKCYVDKYEGYIYFI